MRPPVFLSSDKNLRIEEFAKRYFNCAVDLEAQRDGVLIAGLAAAFTREIRNPIGRALTRSVSGRAIMMDLSTRSVRLFGVLLISVLVASCAQPGAADGVLPTSPGPLSAGPGASYDASGMWRFVTTDVHGNVDDIWDTNVSQDVSGNLSFLDAEGSLVTLERIGTGATITYRFSSIGNEGGDCDVSAQARVRLDTKTNTLSGNLLLRELGCSHDRLRLFVTATKLS